MFKKTTIISICCVLAIIASYYISITTDSYYVFYNMGSNKLPIYCVDTESKKVAITFDCAYGCSHTQDILDCLDEYNVKATFFMVEFWVESNSQLVKTISDKGHEIGTHSKTHPHMSKLSESQIIEELNSSSGAISSLTGNSVNLFRPPYGDYNNLLITTASSLGLYTIQWSVDSLDWKGISSAEIASRVNSKTTNGSIILMHNDGAFTADSLPLIFSTLQTKGYEFVPVSQLIYKDNFTIDVTGKQKCIDEN